MSGWRRLRGRIFALAASWLPLLAAPLLCSVSVFPTRAQDTVLASVTPPETRSEREIVPTCKTDLRLSGAVYDARHPDRSFALVQFRKNERAGLVRIGSSLGGFVLVTIEPRGILLRDQGGESCWLRLLGDPAARARQAAPPPRPRKTKAKASPKKKSEVVVIGHR